jgi:hypothetical protein
MFWSIAEFSTAGFAGRGYFLRWASAAFANSARHSADSFGKAGFGTF